MIRSLAVTSGTPFLLHRKRTVDYRTTWWIPSLLYEAREMGNTLSQLELWTYTHSGKRRWRCLVGEIARSSLHINWFGDHNLTSAVTGAVVLVYVECMLAYLTLLPKRRSTASKLYRRTPCSNSPVIWTQEQPKWNSLKEPPVSRKHIPQGHTASEGYPVCHFSWVSWRFGFDRLPRLCSDDTPNGLIGIRPVCRTTTKFFHQLTIALRITQHIRHHKTTFTPRKL